MVWYFTPYSLEKNLFEAYDKYFELITNPDDWACIMDGDVLFLQGNYGHIIQSHIEKHPETGLFTCFTNRIGNDIQLFSRKAVRIDSIKYHFRVSKDLEKKNKGNSTVHHNRVAGMLMVIKKETWKTIREKVKAKCQDNKLFGVDYMIADTMLEEGLDIRRMEDMYILHYRRLDESIEERGLE